jgi:hypothetical protein
MILESIGQPVDSAGAFNNLVIATIHSVRRNAWTSSLREDSIAVKNSFNRE